MINTSAGSALGTNVGMRLVGNGTPAFYPTRGAQGGSAWFVMNWVDYMAGAIGLPSQAIDGSQQWTGAPLSYTGTWGAGQQATYGPTIWYTVSNAIASGMLSNASYVAAVSPAPTNGGNGSSHMFTTWTLDQIRTGLYQGLLPGSDLPGIGRSFTDPYVNGLLAQTASGRPRHRH